MAKKIIGIDLGTTNSVVAVVEGGQSTIIPNDHGQNTTPSIVAFDKEGKRLVGTVAKRQAVTNPENTIASAKRFIGQKFDETSDEVKRVPYKLTKRSNGGVGIVAQGKEYAPQEISAAILSYLKKTAEDYLGQSVDEAVITVPAYFNDAQRQATKDAGKIAGLGVKRIINEPTAAALAYGVDKKKNGTVVVFDFGGGTFDVSILDINDEVIEVRSTSGDTHLGGDDVDNRIMTFLIDSFKKDQGIDLTQDKMALQRLKEAAEKAKVELSSTTETEVNLPYITADASGPKHLVVKLSRAKLESLCQDIFDRLLEPCKKALQDAGISKDEIADVLLVGGSTRIPKVQQLVKDFFGKEPSKSVNPDEVVAAGAAIQGSVLSGEKSDVLLLDVTPLTLGIETLGGVTTPIVERGTTIPTKRSQVFSTAEDNQPAVDIKVVQGERKMSQDNHLLGQFKLEGIPAAPRGVPQIEVIFDIDANGIVNVSARDKGTGKEQKITITAGTDLSKDEVERMVKDAEKHAAEDKEKAETIEVRNKLDGSIFQVEKNLSEFKDKLGEEETKQVEEALETAKTTLKEKPEDKEALQSANEELLKSAHKLAEMVYKEKGGEQGDAEQAEESPIDTQADSE